MYKEIISKLEKTYNWKKKKKSGVVQILGSSKDSFINLGRIVYQRTKSSVFEMFNKCFKMNIFTGIHLPTN